MARMRSGALPAGQLRAALAAQHEDLLGKYRHVDPATYDRALSAITGGRRLHLHRYQLDDLVPLRPGDPCDPYVPNEDDRLVLDG
ncbi:MAG: hypothetical protein H7233_10375 [Pseudorhodobacter sp.]|nr:hypothetical protein [Frankiaceae bacterium]